MAANKDQVGRRCGRIGLLGVVSGLLGLWTGWACAPAATGPVMGISNYEASDTKVSAASAAASVSAWPWTSASRTWPRAQARPFHSEGHWFGRYEAELVVSEQGAPAYAALGPNSVMPEGTIILEQLRPLAEATSPDAGVGSPKPTMSFGMVKQAGRWSYFELDAAMNVLRQGRLQPCVGCHEQMAFQDELFGVPISGR